MNKGDRRILSAKFDTDTLKLGPLTKAVKALGGRVIATSEPKRGIEKKPEPERKNGIADLKTAVSRLGAEALKKIGLDPLRPEDELHTRFISRDEFDEIALGDIHQFNKGHATIAWNIGFSTSLSAYKEDGPQEVFEVIEDENEGIMDLEHVIAMMRVIEAGEIHHLHGFGAVYWNLYVDLINQKLGKPDQPPLLLKWDSEIHPQLVKANHKTRVVEDLENRYRERAARHTQKSAQLKIF